MNPNESELEGRVPLGGRVESGGSLLTGVEVGEQPMPNRAHRSVLVLVSGVSVIEGSWLVW